jgi:hypothetical protein
VAGLGTVEKRKNLHYRESNPGLPACSQSLYRLCRIRDSAVDIANGYGMDDRGVGIRVPVQSTPTLRPTQWGTGGSFPESKAALA